MLFDTHCHINTEDFAEDYEAVLERAQEIGVKKLAVVGFDKETIARALWFAEKYDWIYAIIGWHPVDTIDCTPEDLEMIRKTAAANPKVVAIGEIGLDYHWDKSPKVEQQALFRQQIEMALALDKPIVIHDRDAHQDVYDILAEYKDEPNLRGIMHSYSSSPEMAERFIKLGFYISLSGVVTFKKARVPHEVAVSVPLDRLLIETDSPYLTPVPYRGKRNEPGYVHYVAEEIAKLRGISYEEVVQATYENACRLFVI
ncbi:TatD family hydrolase [Culicoidibacter larvae]|uniref:TatD family deoxyribonuclease n=1 Tax=Culicoidibacter larvae TaxID=2579976 RepID=A0A5R8QGI7_9FIRM|nr:TatD family hydrolase [Culicoidibacter larvae]TLG77108.1 TatD family deoxyribonuclease [Culicoidibacter larvae]